MVATYFYSAKPHTDITSAYEGRATLDVDYARGKCNLKLSSITLEDNKMFTCRVQIPDFDEGKVDDTTSLVVLGNLSLSCESRVCSSFSFLSNHILMMLVVVVRRKVVFFFFECLICLFSHSCAFRPRL